MKNILKISGLVVATVLITTSFYLNEATQSKQKTYNSSEIIGTYTAKATIIYNASALTDGAVADFSVIDSNITLTVKRKAKEYFIIMDDNDPKTAPNPKSISISKVKPSNRGISFNITGQDFKIDSGDVVRINGLHRYASSNGKSSGLYKPKEKTLMLTMAGKFPKSLDGTKEATVLMNTEIAIFATKK